MHIGRRGNTSGQKCHAKGSRKETKIEEFMYRNTTNMEHEIYDHTPGKTFNEKFRSHTRKTFNRFATEDSCTWNITHNTESISI
jgi:hypothetical protein